MDFLQNLLVFVHFIGLAILLGGFFAQIGKSDLRITPGMFHGALTMLVTGLALVGIASSRHADDPFSLENPTGYPAVDNTKIAVKLLVLIAIFAVIVLNRRKEKVGVAPWLAVGLLGVLNVGIAVFWD
jgi:hypothetical protein